MLCAHYMVLIREVLFIIVWKSCDDNHFDKQKQIASFPVGNSRFIPEIAVTLVIRPNSHRHRGTFKAQTKPNNCMEALTQHHHVWIDIHFTYFMLTARTMSSGGKSGELIATPKNSAY